MAVVLVRIALVVVVFVAGLVVVVLVRIALVVVVFVILGVVLVRVALVVVVFVAGFVVVVFVRVALVRVVRAHASLPCPSHLFRGLTSASCPHGRAYGCPDVELSVGGSTPVHYSRGNNWRSEGRARCAHRRQAIYPAQPRMIMVSASAASPKPATWVRVVRSPANSTWKIRVTP